MDGAEILAISRTGLDLRCRKDVIGWLAANRPDVVVMAAVSRDMDRGPDQILSDNLDIARNVLEGAWQAGVDRLLLLAPPLSTSGLHRAEYEALEVAGSGALQMLEAYRGDRGANYLGAIAGEAYGGGRIETSARGAVMALMLRLLQARVAGEADIQLPMDRAALRPLLHVHDLAEACIDLLQRRNAAIPVEIVGTGILVRDLAAAIAGVVGYSGQIGFSAAVDDLPAPRRTGYATERIVWGAGSVWRKGCATPTSGCKPIARSSSSKIAPPDAGHGRVGARPPIATFPGCGRCSAGPTGSCIRPRVVHGSAPA